MSEFGFFEQNIDEKILNLHTGYLGKVESIKGAKAMVQPLTLYKAIGGKAQKRSVASAVIPENIKYREKTITYRTANDSTASVTVLVPAELEVGDIVYVGVCERDITYAKQGKIAEATNRHHNINDGVIVRVVR